MQHRRRKPCLIFHTDIKAIRLTISHLSVPHSVFSRYPYDKDTLLDIVINTLINKGLDLYSSVAFQSFFFVPCDTQKLT